MANFWRYSRGIITKSLQFQKCFSRSLDVPSSNAKPVVNVPGNLVKNIEIPDPLLYHEVRKLFTVNDLYDAGVHCGKCSYNLNEQMKQFILGTRPSGSLIFDLDQTAEFLGRALYFAAQIAFHEGNIVFVTRLMNILLTEYMTCADEDWRQGPDPNRFDYMTERPDLIIFLNTLDIVEGQKVAREASKQSIPTVGVVDTDCFPNDVTYPIPGNDQRPVTEGFYNKLFKKAILLGIAKRKEYNEKQR